MGLNEIYNIMIRQLMDRWRIYSGESTAIYLVIGFESVWRPEISSAFLSFPVLYTRGKRAWPDSLSRPSLNRLLYTYLPSSSCLHRPPNSEKRRLLLHIYLNLFRVFLPERLRWLIRKLRSMFCLLLWIVLFASRPQVSCSVRVCGGLDREYWVVCDLGEYGYMDMWWLN